MVSTSTFTLITLTLLTTLVSAIPCPGAAPCPKDFRVHPNGNTNYCLTVADLTAKGTPATVQKCDNSAGQSWYWQLPDNSEYVHLRNLAGTTNNLCLAAEACKGASLTLGNQVSLAECFNDGSHTWYPIAESGTIVALALLNDNDMCMELRGGQLDGGAVGVWTCNSKNTDQQWTISA